MDTSSFRNGLVILHKSEPQVIVEFQHVNPGKGSAFVRTRLRSLLTGKVIEFTFKSGEKVEEADVQYLDCQYLYAQGSDYHFMLSDNYEQYSLSADQLGAKINYLKEGQEGKLVFLDGNPFDLQLPSKLEFKVIEAPPGVKGDTATSATKEVTIETGARVVVPIFIKVGDTIRVNIETGAYDVRIN